MIFYKNLLEGLTDDCCYYFAGGGVIAEFAEVNALPDTEIETTFGDGYGQADACHGTFGMGGHVIITFTVMGIVALALPYQLVENNI